MKQDEFKRRFKEGLRLTKLYIKWTIAGLIYIILLGGLIINMATNLASSDGSILAALVYSVLLVIFLSGTFAFSFAFTERERKY